MGQVLSLLCATPIVQNSPELSLTTSPLCKSVPERCCAASEALTAPSSQPLVQKACLGKRECGQLYLHASNSPLPKHSLRSLATGVLYSSPVAVVVCARGWTSSRTAPRSEDHNNALKPPFQSPPELWQVQLRNWAQTSSVLPRLSILSLTKIYVFASSLGPGPHLPKICTAEGSPLI